MSDPTSTTRTSRLLALAMLVSTMGLLGGMVALAWTSCSTISGFGSWLSLFEIVLSIGSALAFASLGTLIVFHQLGNRIGWLCNAIGLTFMLAQFTGTYADCGISGDMALPGIAWIAWLSYMTFPVIVVQMFSLLPFLFPDGRFLSPAWRRLALISTATVFVSVVLTGLVQGPLVHSGMDTNYEVDNPVGLLPPALGPLLENAVLLVVIAASSAGIASLVARLRRSQGQMRQQLKLLLYFLSMAIATQLVIELYGDMVNEAIFQTWIYLLVLVLTFWGFPFVIGLAVFKYRLWDIDIVIRRTLVYAVLTIVLALVYFGSVTLLTSLFSRVVGQQSALAIVISTLLIAALFSPLRQRVQGWIDRRFFRSKYDTQQVLAQFALTARDETDLDALTAELMQVVQEAMQAESVSVLLFDPASAPARREMS